MPPAVDRKTPTGSVETLFSPSEADVATWEVFEALRGVEQDYDQDRSMEISQAVYDFGGLKELPSGVYEAVPLVGLMEKLRSPNREEAQNAFTALKSYNNPKSKQEGEYVRVISTDILELDDFVDEHFLTKNEPELGQETPEEPIVRQHQNPWEKRYPLIPLKDLIELLKSVHIQSILIQIASAYVTLRNSNNASEDQLLKTVYAIEAVYQPLLEIIGFDALASALEDEAVSIHLSRNGGKYGKITTKKFEMAREYLGLFGTVEEVRKDIDVLISRLFHKEAKSRSVVHHTLDHNRRFFAGSVLGPDDNPVRSIARQKGIASTAAKIDEEDSIEDIYISDTIGITMVVSAYEDLAEMFAMGLISVNESSSLLKPNNSPKREKHLVSKGSDVTNAVIAEFKKLGLDPSELLSIEPSSNGHQVAKITLLYKTGRYNKKGHEIILPTEVAFQTEKDRKISRAGKAAHALKYLGYTVSDEDLISIADIYDQKAMIGTGELIPASVVRSDEFYATDRKPVDQKTRIGLGAAAQGRTSLN